MSHHCSGGDYPLSAVLTSEFAPKNHRSRMLAWVFFMQPCGQLIGTVVAAGVTYGFRSRLQDFHSCFSTVYNTHEPECYRAVDRAWRLIIGIGALPAVLAMIIRLQIPESPRYTMDVLLQPTKAFRDARGYFKIRPSEPRPDAIPLQTRTKSPESATSPHGQKASVDSAFVSGSQALPIYTEPGESSSSSVDRRLLQRDIAPISKTLQHSEISTAPSPHIDAVDSFQSRAIPKKDKKRKSDFAIAFKAWRSDFWHYFWKQGNGVHLFGTMASWFLLDVSFYGLGMNSPRTIQKLFDGLNAPDESVFDKLFKNAWHSLVLVSSGALLGGMALIYVIQHSRPVKVQATFFFILGCLLFIIGGLFKPLIQHGLGTRWVLLAAYFFCQFFFNLGANSTTFIVGDAPSLAAYQLIEDRFQRSNSPLASAAHVTACPLRVARLDPSSCSWQ